MLYFYIKKIYTRFHKLFSIISINIDIIFLSSIPKIVILLHKIYTNYIIYTTVNFCYVFKSLFNIYSILGLLFKSAYIFGRP